MKNTIKFFIISLLTLCESPAVAEESTILTKDNYGYIDLGVFLLTDAPLPFPQIGGGFRYQSGSNGMDMNLQIASIGDATVIQEGVNWVFYPHPNISHEYYLGIGPKISELIVRRGVVRKFYFFLPTSFWGNNIVPKMATHVIIKSKLCGQH